MIFINKFKKIIDDDGYRVLLFLILIFLCFFSVYALKPQIAGDGVSYVESIQVLGTGVLPDNFIPNRLLTTYLGLNTIRLFASVFHSLSFAWMFQNSLLYISFGLVFYSILKLLIEDRKASFVGTILLVTNYAAVSFALGYLMDIGGWAFYLLSIYFSYKYYLSTDKKWMWFSALTIGIGGLFKEYAFLATVVLGLVIIILNKNNLKNIFKLGFFSALISFVPIILVNIYIIERFDYSYINWFTHQKTLYPGQNVIVELIKSFGSLYNFGWFLFVPGFYILVQRTAVIIKEKIEDKKIIFIWALLLSALPVLVWPPVTRVLFVTMPAVITVSCLFIKKIDSKWWIVLPLLSLYFVASFLMDSLILNFVNLPF